MFLTAGQRVKTAVSQNVETNVLDSRIDDPFVLAGSTVEQPVVSGTAHCDDIVDGEVEIMGAFLQHHTDTVCDFASGQSVRLVTTNPHPSRVR